MLLRATKSYLLARIEAAHDRSEGSDLDYCAYHMSVALEAECFGLRTDAERVRLIHRVLSQHTELLVEAPHGFVVSTSFNEMAMFLSAAQVPETLRRCVRECLDFVRRGAATLLASDVVRGRLGRRRPEDVAGLVRAAGGQSELVGAILSRLSVANHNVLNVRHLGSQWTNGAAHPHGQVRDRL